jgi:outer membrane protein assembly factor BamB/plastocyanin
VKGFVFALATAALLAPASSAQAATCAAADAPGGEWPFYGGTLDSHRNQLAESTISTATVGQLGVAWKLTTPDTGVIHSTPTVADGCVFAGTEFGNVYAVNADTGEVVWTRQVFKSDGSGLAQGAGIVGSPAIADGRVIVPITTSATGGGGVLAALDQATGTELWRTVIDDDDGSGLDSSPVPFNGMIFQAFKGDEASDHSNPGFAFVDAATGAILRRTNVIPAADFAEGYRGGSIINTPSVDLENQLVYAGTGNPVSPKQHPHTDALLKIDANPASPTFGEILASHRGTSDSYPVPQDVDSPVCQTDVQWPVGRASCGQFDYNFLSSPAIWNDSTGRPLFGGVQKSGVFTAVYRDTMELAFQYPLGPPCLACNLSSIAVDDKGVYVAVTGGNLYSLNKDTGLPQWVTPLTGSLRMNGLAVANGVVYSLNDTAGTLQAFDAATGVPVFAHPFSLDNQSPMHDIGNSSGVSVARNTVFATSQWNNASTLFALKPGATGGGGGGGGGLPPLPGGGGGGGVTNAQIVTGPSAATYGYVTAVSLMTAGGKATYSNTDIVRHNVVASAKGADGLPLFKSALAGTGERVPVAGVEKLKAGTYQFFCAPHPNMKGQLVVR